MSEEQAPEAVGEAHGCPPAEVLTSLAEGRLAEQARPALERHLVACTLCRAITAGIAAAAGRERPPSSTEAPTTTDRSPSPAAPAARGRRRLWLLLAVVIALALIVWWLVGRGGGTTEPSNAPGTTASRDAETLFAESVHSVVTARPDLLAGFVPLDEAELRVTRPEPQRDGIEVVGPRATVLSVRPSFRWLASGRAQVHTLVLRDEHGTVTWSKRIEGVGTDFPSDEPDLPPGSAWTWSVSARRASGPVEGTLGFRVAGTEQARHYRECVEVIRARAAPEVADLLAAHVALRAELLEEAELLLSARADGAPRHAYAQATLTYVRARLGLPAAPR